MINLKEVPAFRVLFNECLWRGLSVTVHEDPAKRDFEIQINLGNSFMQGRAWLHSLDSFSMAFESPQGTIRIVDEAGLRGFVRGLFSEHLTAPKPPLPTIGTLTGWPEMGSLAFWTDANRFDVKVTVMEKPADDGSVRCRVDYGPGRGCVYLLNVSVLRPRTGEEPMTLSDQPNYPVGVALEDAKPIPGTDPVRYEPIEVFVYAPGDRKAAEAAVRANSDRMVLPRSPLGILAAEDAIEDLRGENIPLADLIKLRDRLNEVIYDREKA